MGERLAKEVVSVVAHRPELRKISFLSHSLGGVVARYAIARLYTQNDERSFPEESGDCKTCNSGIHCLEYKLKGKIAGLEPVNFITFATPHLGSRFHKQMPILRGSAALEKVACRISWIAGRTGKQLFLKDHDDGKPPLLLQMVYDNEDLQFMSALQCFNRRVAYSNVCFDFAVGWKTSSIRSQPELPKRQNFMKNERYPHIVYEEEAKVDTLEHEDIVESIVSRPMTTAEMEGESILYKFRRCRCDLSHD
ncbi:putative lipase YOR059C [Asparagus officinalis]|uniref:putative lipase YOR059C n=1 Tax=Asparagus officinalis TaxID=4686 RepID=UPI00098E6BAA|nr:putative lipase YOR059C [Asparagus officinalis]